MASRRFSPTGRAADGEGLHHYRVVAVTSDVGALIESAGGFLCDRARAGWDVSVLCAAPGETRPLTILGVSAHPVADRTGGAGAQICGLGRGTTLIVGADLLGSDPGLRTSAARLAVDGSAAVHVWGPAAHIGHRAAPIRHELSSAARAFKTSALQAARIDRAAGTVESMYRLSDGSFRRLHLV